MAGLKSTLENLVRQAKTTGLVARSRLPRGLNVALFIDKTTDILFVQLSRVDVYPSKQERDTILKNLPGNCNQVISQRNFTQNGMYYLQVQTRIVKLLFGEPGETDA